MNNTTRWIGYYALIFALLGSACGGTLDDQSYSDGEISTPQRAALLYGTVQDMWGAPLAGARVELLGTQVDPVFTEQNGSFSIPLSPDQSAYRVMASRDGFVNGFARWSSGQEQQERLVIELVDTGATGTFQSATGRTVEIAHAGATLRLPDSGLVYEDSGQPVTEEVEYRITHVPPSRTFGAEESGVLVAVDVELWAAGEPVNLAPGYTAEIELEASYLDIEDDYVALTAYYFDPSTYMWVAEGQWPTLSTETGIVWRAEIRHFSSHGGGSNKVTICHVPPGNPDNAHTISVGQPAVSAHMAHGDTMGACPGSGPDDPDGGADADCRCMVLDFETDAEGNAILAGQDLSEAYTGYGIHIATSQNGSHTTLPIAFDSSSPTGGDMDLGTPNEAYGGPGIGSGGASNEYAMGMVMVVAEDTVDADSDGLVDDPDDGEGTHTFTFDSPTCIHTIEFLDVYDKTARLWLYDTDGDQIGGRRDISVLGENAYQLVDLNTCNVGSMQIEFRRSGGVIGEIGLCLGGDDGVCEDAGDPCEGGGSMKAAKVTICHIPPGNPGNAHTIRVSVNALNAHLAHGDYEGPCEDDDAAEADDHGTDDVDNDGVIDMCDSCPGSDDGEDADGDGVPDSCDLCDGGDDARDTDGDGMPDACDDCSAGNDFVDEDGDGIPDACDLCPDADDNDDADGDGVPDACDSRPYVYDDDDADGNGGADGNGDGVPDACDPCPDADDDDDMDGDGVPDAYDRCPDADDYDDADWDGVPDACDVCAGGDDAIDDNSNGTPDACEDTCTHSRELCDGIDNDCDGLIDEDDTLCGPGAICVDGRCIVT